MSSGADFGVAIWILLRLRRMSQTDLARAAGLSDKTLSAWNTLNRKPDQVSLERVAAALDIPLAELQGMAAMVARIRAKSPHTPPQPASPQRGYSVAEVSRFQFLSDDDLALELGRARAWQLEVEWEIQTRKRVG
jgi:transcriptional regulator with XRE-family HTH domain